MCCLIKLTRMRLAPCDPGKAKFGTHSTRNVMMLCYERQRIAPISVGVVHLPFIPLKHRLLMSHSILAL